MASSQQVNDEVRTELRQATSRFGSFASAHEGHSVILEELDELWDEIKGGQDPQRMREEAVQIAAMAMRFVIDVCADTDCPECGAPYGKPPAGPCGHSRHKAAA